MRAGREGMHAHPGVSEMKKVVSDAAGVTGRKGKEQDRIDREEVSESCWMVKSSTGHDG